MHHGLLTLVAQTILPTAIVPAIARFASGLTFPPPAVDLTA